MKYDFDIDTRTILENAHKALLYGQDSIRRFCRFMLVNEFCLLITLYLILQNYIDRRYAIFPVLAAFILSVVNAQLQVNAQNKLNTDFIEKS